MNNRLYIIAAALCILAVSCGIKEQREAIHSFGGYEEFFATIEQPAETDTKTFTDNDLHVLWHEDDRVTIFNKFSYNQEFAFTGETGDNSGGFSKVGGDEFVTGFDLANVYSVYPYQKSTKIDSDGKMTIILPAEQAWAERSFSRGANTMIAATADNKLKFKNIGGLLVLKLYGAWVNVSSVTLKGNAGELIAGKASVTMPIDGLPEVEMQEGAADAISLLCETPVALGSTEADYTEFWLVIPPTDFTRGFTITVTGADGGTFEKSTDKSISIARNHISRMAPIEVSLEKPAAEPEWVDLGLSVKWATFNVGASKPEEYGDYFAWGETEPKSDYSWATYKFELGTDYNGPFSKYVTQSSYGTVDNKTVLEPEDDAAHVNWGGTWRMPTDAEWTELRENCTWTWTSDYNGTGIAGNIVTSNKSGYTEKSIFIPAAGSRIGSSLSDAGSYGYYWSSSVFTDHQGYAWTDYFNSGNVYWSSFRRYRGQSVRPVYGEFVPVESVSLDMTSLGLCPGGTKQLTATVSPSNATAKDVLWVSSDTGVVSVDEFGFVTAEAVGNAIITAYASSGVSVSCEVTVESISIKDFAKEYVKVLNIWQNNVGTINRLSNWELAAADDKDIVENAHYVPSDFTIEVGGRTYTTGDMLETALRSYLLLRGWDGNETEKAGWGNIPATTPVAMSKTIVPATHEFKFLYPLIESSNGGYLYKVVDGKEVYGQVDPVILDNWAQRSVNWALTHDKMHINLCGYPRADHNITNYGGCFSSGRALLTYAFFFKYMLDNNLDKADALGADVVIRSELFGIETASQPADDGVIKDAELGANIDLSGKAAGGSLTGVTFGE